MKKTVIIVMLMLILCSCKREGIIKGKIIGSDERETFSIVDEDGTEKTFGINDDTVFISPDENIDIKNFGYIVSKNQDKFNEEVYKILKEDKSKVKHVDFKKINEEKINMIDKLIEGE